MYFLSAAGTVALAALTAASTLSSPSDLDASVWEALSPVEGRSLAEFGRNRPVKRQSGWNPPSALTSPLKQVWDHCKETYNNGNLFGFKNYGWDQLIANKGSINMCVRWESSASVTEAQRKQVETALKAQYQIWFKWLYGFDNFPYSNVDVKVVGWAVRDKSLLQGSTTGIDVYTDKDGEGIPQCAPACGRFFNQNNDYSKCAGGAARHYDHSLWLTDGMGGGTGGDWGQRIGREYFMGQISAANIHILLHEMGHTFGLDDFYDWSPAGVPGFIMKAGAAAQVTEFDGWMFRNWWYELSRNRGWQSGNVATQQPATPSKTATPPKSTNVVVPPAQTTTPTKTTAKPPPAQTTAASGGSGSGSGAAAQRWQQCGGGAGYTGPTRCASGLTCTKHNEWYSQCL